MPFKKYFNADITPAKSLWVIPIVTGVSLILVTLGLWWMLSQREYDNMHAKTQVEATKLLSYIKADMNSRVSGLQRMAKRWEVRGGTPRKEFVENARNYISDFPGFQAIEWVDSNYNVQWIIPLKGNEKAQGLNLGFEKHRRIALEEAKSKYVPTLTSPITLVQGGTGLHIYVPIHLQGKFGGFVLSVLRIQPWLSYIFSSNETAKEKASYVGAVQIDGQQVFNQGSVPQQQLAVYKASEATTLYGHEISVIAYPSSVFIQENSTLIPEFTGFIGLLLSVLVAFVVYLHQAKSLEKRNALIASLALRKTSDSLSLATQVGKIGIWTWDIASNNLVWNDRMLEIYGISKDTELVFETWRNSLHPDDRATTVRLLKDAVDGHATYDTEFRIVLYDGEIRYIHSAATIERGDNGEPLFATGINIDITHRKEASEIISLLEEVQRTFIRDLGKKNRQDLFEDVLAGILRISGSAYGLIGEVLYDEKNKPYLKTYALSNISWDKNSRQIYEKESPEGIEFHNPKTLLGAVLETGEAVISNAPLQDPRRGGTPGGHPSLDSFLGIPLGEKGALTGIIGLANRPGGYNKHISDMLRPLYVGCQNMIQAFRAHVDREQAKQYILERENRISAIINHAVDTIITINDKGIIQSFNPAAEKMFGYASTEVIGENIKLLMPDPTAGQHDGYLATYFKTGKKNIIGIGREVVARKKNGDPIDVDLSISEWVSEGRKMFAGILHDLTDRKVIEKQQMQIAEEKSRFASVVSHELRTPMAAISEGVSLLASPKTGSLNTKQKDLAGLVDRNIGRLSRLLNAFLDYNRFQSKAIKLDLKKNDINSLVSDVVKMMTTQAEVRNLKLEMELFPGELPVQCDADKITQVLTNFVHNSIKFTEKGSVKIQTEKDGDHVKISVIDTGLGVSAEDQERLFKPFEQVTNIQKGRPVGSGMGLAIVKQLIDMHHGQLGISSRLGEGATFYFTLPIMHS